jgi:WD40 repeat protein
MIQMSHGYPISEARFTPSAFLLTGGQDGKMRVWDTATGQEADRTFRHSGRIRAVSASPDDLWAATASEDGTARLWSFRTGRPIGACLRHDPSALCAVIDPGNRWLVTAGEDHNARLVAAPSEFVGLPDQINLWAKIVTGAELDSRGDLTAIDPASWQQLRSAYQQAIREFVQLRRLPE